ncbi:hypothetical protein [Polaribacter cellanae]|uniref:Uncharacterized protein n=1 Tax=Polaribacter cellanae TaxID=2818493 RepID=A0A975H6C1_9FLAO|nr:hypothetical protein [Polaribacter cellanae]QTE21838.1 hypothetical protein J3359_13575 [Polaribacter cellanae]
MNLVKSLVLSGVLGVATLAGFNSSVGESVDTSVSGSNSTAIFDASRNRTTTTRTTTTTTTTTTRTSASKLEAAL